MSSLSNQLRSVISQRLEAASPSEILQIVSMLCNEPAANATTAVDTAAREQYELVDSYGVRDNATGIVWTREPVAGGKRNWADSIDAASKVTFGGYKWRAPTIQEQLTLVDYGRFKPAINPIFICEKDAWFWTSTTDIESPGDCAWGVGFGGGGSGRYYHSGYGFVRAVRVGQF